MATRNLVPQANGEGNLGTADKSWLKGFFQSVRLGSGAGDKKILKSDSLGDASWSDSLESVEMKNYRENVNAKGSIQGAQRIDLADGNIVTATITGATSLTFSGASLSNKCYGFTLFLTNGGSATITWPSGMKWPEGTAPTLTTSGTDILAFMTVDGGTSWYGAMALNDCKPSS